MSSPLSQTLEAGRTGDYSGISQFSVALMPLLSALGWRGDPRSVAGALPHFETRLDLTGLRNALSNLNFRSRPVRTRLNRLDPRLMPCLFVPDGGDVMVVLGDDADGLRVFDAGVAEERTVRPTGTKGTAYFFSAVDLEQDDPARTRNGWFVTVFSRFRGFIGQVVALTLIVNLLALAAPLFVMAVYDRVIATGSLDTLHYLVIGVALALSCDLAIRAMRARLLAYMAARLDMLIGSAVFQKIMYLPTAQTERATVGAQIARFREFDAVRDFFVSPMAMAFLDLPFVAIFVATIAVIGGPIAWVPVGMLAAFVAIGLLLLPPIQRGVAESLGGSAGRQAFLVETVSKLRAVKLHGAEDVWLERFRDYSAQAAMTSFRSARIAAFVQSFAHLMMVTAGVLTLALGTERVMADEMTIGALVASMALAWRVLSPLQTLFVTLTRLEQVKTGVKRINQLMTMRTERDPHVVPAGARRFKGTVDFNRVSLRYSSDTDPALIGASFRVAPGEIVAITGSNGSGKSTILKLIAGLYQPQAGSVTIDGVDVRQIDPIELRQAIGYAPQNVSLFHGSILQNLLLANPTARHDEIVGALARANVLDDVESLPEGLDTRISERLLRRYPNGFQQRLSLARAYLRNASIMLFDEPGNDLDVEDDQAFMRALDEMRGRQTVFLVTHRPSHMRLADRMLVLNRGVIRFAGPPAEVMPQIPDGLM